MQELERMIGNREVIISTTVNKIDEVPFGTESPVVEHLVTTG